MKVLARLYVALAAFSLAGCGPAFTLGELAADGGPLHLEHVPAADAGDVGAELGPDGGGPLEADTGTKIHADPIPDGAPAPDMLEAGPADGSYSPGDENDASSSPGEDSAAPAPDAGRAACVQASACPAACPVFETVCCSAMLCGCAVGSGVCR